MLFFKPEEIRQVVDCQLMTCSLVDDIFNEINTLLTEVTSSVESVARSIIKSIQIAMMDKQMTIKKWNEL